MKQTLHLERLQSLLCMVHLFLMSCCLALPLFFVVTEYPDGIQLLFALGACAAVLCVQLLAHLPRRGVALACALALAAGCIVLVPTTLLRVYYGLMLALQLLICFVLPRPEGRTVLSVPKFWHLPAPAFCYAMAKVLSNPLLPTASAAVALFFLLNYALYTNTTRLLRALRDFTEAEHADQRIIRLNRRLMLLFAIVGTMLIVGLLLWRQPQPARDPTPLYEQSASAGAPTEESDEETSYTLETNIVFVPPGVPIDVTPGTNATMVVLYVFLALGFGLVIFAIISWLRSIIGSRRRRHSPAPVETFAVEPLPVQKSAEAQRAEPPARGWAGRIRRLYARTILSRTGGKTPLSALTPTELEQVAAIPPGQAGQTLHRLYAQARYSADVCGRQDYLTARDACARLKKGGEAP